MVDVEHGLEDREHGFEQFRKSDWFTRGWTLQELLAPRKLAFVDRKWRFFGLRDQLEEIIAEVTEIPIGCLGSLSAREARSVATRMKWAAKRQTSRTEDKAYCLLGLFNVNMPLLYGEGFKAFKRLQEEIIRQSDDESIFVHKHSSHLSPLAYSPADYGTPIQGAEVWRGSWHELRATDLGSTSYTVTNKGIQMRAAFVGGEFFRQGGRAIALNCRFGDYPILLPVERMYSDRDFAVEDSLLFKKQRPREGDLTPLHVPCPEPYNVALSKTGNRSEMVVAAEKYLDSWLAAGGVLRTGEPFLYQTIYLGSTIHPGSGYVGQSRGLGTAWAFGTAWAG